MERKKGKIEGYCRDIDKLGMTDMRKIKAIVVESGDRLIVKFDDGDGILYEIIEDLINPLRMIKTLSENEIKKYSWTIKKKLKSVMVSIDLPILDVDNFL